MKAKTYLALLLSAGMILQTVAGNVAGTMEVYAEELYVTEESLGDYKTAAPAADSVVPSENQYEYQKQELAAFCHFGMNTYTGSEWGNGKEDPKSFQLKNTFDADTYVKAISDAGFKKLIITAKHHDGFCIWPSDYTEHDTQTSGYQGDVLEELSTACTKYNIDMGLYLSPWDVNSPYYGYYDEKGNPLTDNKGNPKDGMTWEQVEEKDPLDYNEYYNNQLKEILGNEKYGNAGRFKEVWMDGAKGEGSAVQNYNFDLWFETIQKEEGKKAGKFTDDCLQFGSGEHTTVHWIGNESGLANEKTWAKAKVANHNFDSNLQNTSSGKFAIGFPDGNKWSVPEADTKITSGWFWGPNKKAPISMEQLADIYFRSVGHNATLLLNVPPNREGTVDKDILARLSEFGTAIKNTFKENLAADATVKATQVRGNDTAFSPKNVLDKNDKTYWTVEDGTSSASLVLELNGIKTFDVVSIEEAIQFGQRIGSFRVEYRTGNGEWKKFDEGTTIGAKRLCRKSPVKADQIKITVTADEAAEHKEVMLSEVGVYRAAEGFSLGNGIPSDLQVIDNKTFTASSGWNHETNDQMLEGTGMWIKGNPNNPPYVETTFTGTKFWVIGTIDPGHGPADIYIDGVKAASINTNSNIRKLGQTLYESGTLDQGDHTVKIVNTGNAQQALGLDALLVLNNGGAGMIELEKSSYRMNEDTTMPILLKRVGGTKGEVKVQFEVSPGSAWQKHFNADGSMEIVFADGQDHAEASVTTKRVADKDGDLYFNIGLTSATGGALIGFNANAKVVIADTESYSKEDLEKKVQEAEEAGYEESLYTSASYQALQEALKQAKNVLKSAHPSAEDVAKASSALEIAVASMTKREVFSEEDAFVMPKIKGTSKNLEAEYFILDSSAAVDKEKRYVRIQSDGLASNGKKVGWFEPGNVIKVPFYAEKAGTYTFTATYQSGRTENNPNSLNWSGTNVESGALDVHGSNPNNPVFDTCSFEVVVTTEGNGELVFTANEKASPNLDKFTVTATDVSSGSFEIGVTVGGNGSVEGVDGSSTVTVTEGESKTFVFVPNEGFAVKDVIVDGASVGPMPSYTFDAVMENGHTIEVLFEKELYDSENRFEFPVSGNAKTLEAERFELINTGEEEQWPLQISEGEWASNGKFVNALNSGDQIKLYYHAAEAGEYTVTAYYRSGSSTNALVWEEETGMIEAGNVSAGAEDSAAEVHQAEFTLHVTQPGAGCLVFTAPEGNSPQLDKFEIRSNGTPANPLNTVALQAAVDEASAIELDKYKDGEAKDNFIQQLSSAQQLLEQIQNGSWEITQEQVDAAENSLKEAQGLLEEKDQRPAVDKSQLQKAIDAANAIDLSKYQEEGKDVFAEALRYANEVMADPSATADLVTEATLKLNAAIGNLKLADSEGNGGDSGDSGNGGDSGDSGNSGDGGNSGNSGNDGNSGNSENSEKSENSQNNENNVPSVNNRNNQTAQTSASPAATGDCGGGMIYLSMLILSVSAFIAGLTKRKDF